MSTRAERNNGLWRTEIVRAVLSGHSVLGISFAAAIYIVCLSGTLCVFLRDWQRWEQPRAPIVHSVSDAGVAKAITTLADRFAPARQFLFVSLPSSDAPRLTLSTGDDPDDQTWIADADGRLAAPQASPWADFIGDLHMSLMLPETWGRFIVGLAGVALLSSLISGVLAHPRIFRDAFHLRWGGSRRLEQADLHNRLGVWPLPFHILVSLTGALLGLSTIIVGVLAMLLFRGDTQQVYRLLYTPPPAVDARPAPMPDISRLLAAARAASPGAAPRQISVFHWGRRDMRLLLSAARPGLIGMQDEVDFDASGHIVAQKHPRDQNLGTRILGALGPLHFGWYGGLVVRLAYGLLGLALCVVTASGVNVWLARRRDKGRPSPALERLWMGLIWGQPAVLAAVALATRLTGLSGPVPTVIWALGSVLVPTAASQAKQMSRQAVVTWCRTATACLLLLIAGSGLMREPTADPAAVAIDAVLLLAAIALARPAWSRTRRAAPVAGNAA